MIASDMDRFRPVQTRTITDDDGHSRRCVQCSVVYCKDCKERRMKKLGWRKWIHPGACQAEWVQASRCRSCGRPDNDGPPPAYIKMSPK